MKPLLPIIIAATGLFCITGCDKSSQRVTELERKANEALARQQELERQLEDQRQAAERDAIERERQQIEEARAALEQQQQDNSNAEADALRRREEELARREGRLEQAETTLQEQTAGNEQREAELSQRDRELAGREALAAEEPNANSGGPVADYGMFYDSLSSYGSWFETPDYGYVWQPVIVRDVSWRPYTRGRWVCSDYGWTWLSEEPFGWATYHYGRWALLRGHGWVWVPGSEWAPSWVSWRSSGSCIGWAPLPPETLAWRSHDWGNTVDVTFSIGASWFSFVEYRYFGEPIYRHCLPYRQNNDYYHQTVNITNIHVYNHRIVSGGPGYDDIRRKGCKSLPFYRLDVDRHDRPGRDSLAMRPRIEDGRLRIAAPNVDAAWNESLKPSKIKRRIDNVTVERPEALKPEIMDNFRKYREKDRSLAEKSVAEFGGREAFNQRRLETLEANRRQFAAPGRDKDKPRNDKPQITGLPKPGEPERTDRGNQQPQLQQQREPSRPQPMEDARRRLQQPERNQTEAPRPDLGQNTRPQQPQVEQARREPEQQRNLPPKPQPEENRRLQLPGKPQPEIQRPEADNTARQEQQLEQARQQQLQQQREQFRQKQLEDTKQQQLEQARRDQEQQLQRQREQFRQKQLEDARQQQLEQARRNQEQQLQQLREQSRQKQLEDARQQQLEQTRRDQEQQLQQQREQSRQRQLEEARQQQFENARRQQEQARQQQQEQAQREQQRQQEQQQRQQQQSRDQQQKDSLKDDAEKRLRGR